MRRHGVLVALTLVVAACGGAGDAESTVVAAGTTIVDNGVVEYLVAESPFAESMNVLAATSAEALTLLEQGAADLAIVHAPDRLATFLQQNPQAQSAVLFQSRFVLVGPPDKVAEYDGLSAPEAFAKLALRGDAFVTRADGSGTYESESKVWEASGVDRTGAAWLTTTGQGMGFTLQVAVDREAFIWVEEGTLVGSPLANRVQAVELADADSYPNIYTAVWLDSGGDAGSLVGWIRSPEGDNAIAAMNDALFGRRLVVQVRG
ncbi:lysR substrate binding domain protein [bacterium BMS3Bbin02]|nr:lysR substrate binding domain protein [bacterium BMS3Bbin02]